MSRVSRKVNELKADLDSISGLSDEYVFKQLIRIKLIINDIQRYANDYDYYYEGDFNVQL